MSSHDHPKAKVMRVRPQWPTRKMARQADESPDEHGTRSVSRVHWARREGQPGSGSGPPNHVGFRQLSGGHAGFPRSHTSAPRFGTREGHGRGTSSLVRLCLLSPVSEALVPSAQAHISRESVCVRVRACVCICVHAARVCGHVCGHVCACVACARACDGGGSPLRQGPAGSPSGWLFERCSFSSLPGQAPLLGLASAQPQRCVSPGAPRATRRRRAWTG